ncbi:MAG: REP-associated tyrosine transposase [Planctomycetales bacterium]|jgi:putative transposase
MGRTRFRFDEERRPHFLTCTVVGWLPVFTRPDCVQIILDSLGFLQREDRITLLAYVVMENHLHLIASAENLSKEIGSFKSFTARQILDRLVELNETTILRQLKAEKMAFKNDRQFQFWQEGSHPQVISDEAMMWQKLEYIRNNPVKRGYVDDPLAWRYSSARNYARRDGLIPVTTDWQ